MAHRNDDIESLILDIARADLTAQDETLDRAVREDFLVQFVRRTSAPLIALLDELKGLRERIAEGGASGGVEKTHRVILEGYSEKDASEALSAALDKAAKYFSDDHDIAITVEQLIELPNGGHRATIEVHITPMSLHDKAHIKGVDIELKRDHDHAYRDSRNKEAERLEHLVFDHFSKITKAKTEGHLPPTLLIDVNDAKLMHYLLEKQFLKAEMGLPHSLDDHAPNRILVRRQVQPERDYE